MAIAFQYYGGASDGIRWSIAQKAGIDWRLRYMFCALAAGWLWCTGGRMVLVNRLVHGVSNGFNDSL